MIAERPSPPLPPHLQGMVQDAQWDEWLKGKKYRTDGDDVAATLLSARFWKRAGSVLQLISPIYDLLRLTDRQAPVLSKIYFRCFQLQEHFQSPDIAKLFPEGLLEEAHQFFQKRCGLLFASLRHGLLMCLTCAQALVSFMHRHLSCMQVGVAA